MATATSGSWDGQPGGGDRASDLAVIREQTRESLELLRSLVALMLPKQADGDGPKLEDLIAALTAQQRDILLGIRQVQADLAALFDRIDGEPTKRANGGGRPNGVGRA